MSSAENAGDILTEAQLDAVNGGYVAAAVVGAIGLFGLGMIVGMSGCWEDLPAGAPRTLNELYASW
jgi:hypothetical protein